MRKDLYCLLQPPSLFDVALGQRDCALWTVRISCIQVLNLSSCCMHFMRKSNIKGQKVEKHISHANFILVFLLYNIFIITSVVKDFFKIQTRNFDENFVAFERNHIFAKKIKRRKISSLMKFVLEQTFYQNKSAHQPIFAVLWMFDAFELLS